MKKLILVIAMFGMMILPGCGNLSPRQDQRINNQDGKIGEIENLANSIKAEVGNLKTQNEIQNSKIGQMQQGLANVQSNYENSGIQILSGPGGLIVSLVGLMAATVLALHFRSLANVHAQTAEILAQSIAAHEDPALEDQVFQAAMYTPAEENVLKLITKHRNLIQSITPKV
jgi:predicted PurR-regulated permease PerM